MRLRLLTALLFVVLAACVPESRPSATPDDSAASPTAGAAATPSEPVATPEPSATIEPTDEPVVTPSAGASPSEETPSESVGPGATAGCSGTDKNRLFFEEAAADLSWTVYCGVLPSGWFVQNGNYRTAGGGRMEIAYRGPGGARLELHEGAFCSAADGCVPSGIEVGDAQFGDQSGTLIATDDGGWALVVEGDGTISWLVVGSGLDEETFRALAGDVAAVSG